ncbi:hypothetical protein N7534_011404 [Penicillium rubens]|nr:hypothetical protein N7534_011404 [Penicillium rubens]
MEKNIAQSYGYVDPNFPNPGGERDTPVIIYGYTPSIALAAFAAAWFFLHFVYHTAQTIKNRSWWWMTFSAALIPRVGSRYSFLPPKVILAFFITSDVISTIVQVAGACLIGVKESRRQDPTTANNILLGGLAYQVFVMTIFVILAASFQFRARHAIRANELGLFCFAFSISTLMVYLRTIFRLAETAQGLMGELQTKEVYFACLEFAPIALVVLLFAIWYPGRCVGAAVRVNDKS